MLHMENTLENINRAQMRENAPSLRSFGWGCKTIPPKQNPRRTQNNALYEGEAKLIISNGCIHAPTPTRPHTHTHTHLGAYPHPHARTHAHAIYIYIYSRLYYKALLYKVSSWLYSMAYTWRIYYGYMAIHGYIMAIYTRIYTGILKAIHRLKRAYARAIDKVLKQMIKQMVKQIEKEMSISRLTNSVDFLRRFSRVLPPQKRHAGRRDPEISVVVRSQKRGKK